MKNKEVLSKKIIITGGGSGGHVSAVQSLISELEKRYILNDNNLMYVGGDLGMVGEEPGNSIEQRTFKDSYIQCKYIRAGKLQRQFNFNSLKLLFRTILGFCDSYKIIKAFRPEIILSTGGFVSVPICILGKLFKADIYLHEQTSTVGISNKIVSFFAKKIYLTYPNSKKYFSNRPTLHTGNLLRPEIFSKTGKGELVNILKKMIVKQNVKPIIYISGGSLGSHIINENVRESLPHILENFQLVLQTGDNKKIRDYDLLINEQKKLDIKIKNDLYITKYVNKEDIGYLLNNIDLFIGRAGANTVYEIGVFKIPAIFIPIPWVTHNEQYENAKILKDLGLAEIINEGELTPEKLSNTLKTFWSKKKTINKEKLESIFITNAAERIIDDII